MGCCSQCGQAPCSCCGDFTRVSDLDQSHTLVGNLVPVVDQIRDLYACFGARPYEVILVWTRWSGGERGLGVEEVVLEEFLLPTPLVQGMELSANLVAMGAVETGGISVSEISLRYDEDLLLGRRYGEPIPLDHNFYWEVRTPQGKPPDLTWIRRRFTPSGTPSRDPMKFQWRQRLVKQSADRARSGEIR